MDGISNYRFHNTISLVFATVVRTMQSTFCHNLKKNSKYLDGVLLNLSVIKAWLIAFREEFQEETACSFDVANKNVANITT